MPIFVAKKATSIHMDTSRALALEFAQ